MDIYKELSSALQNGELDRITGTINTAIKNGYDAGDLLDNGMIPGIEVVGEKFGNGDLFIPEVMLSAKCMQHGMDLLKPFIVNSRMNLRGRIVIGTVAGDVHDLGKNLVGMMFTANGYEVIDLGVNVKPERFAAALQEHKPDFLGLSALLTTTMNQMAETVSYLRENNNTGSCRIIVGGAPVTEDFAREIGADLYADDAIEAVALVREIAGGD